MSHYRPEFAPKRSSSDLNGRTTLFVNNAIVVPWNAWDVVKAVLLIVGLFVVAVVVLIVVLLPVPEGAAIILEDHLSVLMGYGVMMAGVWYFSIRKYGVSWRTLGFRRVSGVHLFLLPPIVVALSWGFDMGYTLLVSSVGAEALIPEQETIEEIFGEDTFKPLIYFNVNVLAPVMEEVLFRGFMLAGLALTLGRVSGLIISSALFAAVHLDMDLMPPIFVFGMLIAWLYIRTGSLWPPIAAHALNNVIATLQEEFFI